MHFPCGYQLCSIKKYNESNKWNFHREFAYITSFRLNAERKNEKKNKMNSYCEVVERRESRIQLTFWHLNLMHGIKFGNDDDFGTWNNGPTTDPRVRAREISFPPLSLSLSPHLMLIIKHALRKMGAKNQMITWRGMWTWIIVSYNVI